MEGRLEEELKGVREEAAAASRQDGDGAVQGGSDG